MTVQAMEDASPTKWHLAHTSWFFETFVLAAHLKGYEEFDPAFNYCFNSYYESQGLRQPRAKRGLLSRPSCERIFAYRLHVDAGLKKLFANCVEPNSELARRLLSPLASAHLAKVLADSGKVLSERPIDLTAEHFRIHLPPHAPPQKSW